MKHAHYKWPSKVTKYGITCPFQRVLVAKYENQIDWNGDRITAPDALDRHIRERMLPSLRLRIDPTSKRHHYCNSINIDHLLANPAPHGDEVRALINSVGNTAVIEILLDRINRAKRSAFERWWHYITQENPAYTSIPAFQYLILRPVIDSSDAKCMQAPVNPDAEALANLFDDIKAEKVKPSDHLLRKLCELMAFGGSAAVTRTAVLARTWVRVDRRDPVAANRLSALAQGSGWCVASPFMAGSYLHSSDFHILLAYGRPVAALRTSAGVVEEIQGQRNHDPGEGWPSIVLFCKARSLRLSHRADAFAYAAAALVRRTAVIDDVEQLSACLASEPAAVAFIPDPMADSGRYRDLVERAWQACLAADPRCACLFPAWMESDPTYYEIIERAWLGQLKDNAQSVVRLPQRLQSSPLLTSVRRAAWLKVVGADAPSFECCPPEYQADKDFLAARRRAWLSLIEVDAPSFERCPPEYRTGKDFLAARRRAWLKLVEVDAPSFERCPPEYQTDEDFLTAHRRVWRTLMAADAANFERCPPELRKNRYILGAGQKAWVKQIEVDAPSYERCPPELRSDPRILSARHAAWLKRVRDDTAGYELCPPDLRDDKDMLRARRWPWLRAISQDPTAYDTCPADLRHSPLMAEARRRSWVKAFTHGEATSCTCPPDVIEHLGKTKDLQLCADFIARFLTFNKTGHFSDQDLPAAIRARTDFKAVRELGWLSGVERRLPLALALPEDLRACPAVYQTVAPEHAAILRHWALMITSDPWQLDGEDIQFPQPLRGSRAILDAYLEGWQRQLQRTPWRIWHEHPDDRRTYITPVALDQPLLIDAMTEGWVMGARLFRLENDWRKMEGSTLSRLPVQLAVLRALPKIQLKDKLLRKILADIVNAKQTPAKSPSSLHQAMKDEIRSCLFSAPLSRTSR